MPIKDIWSRAHNSLVLVKGLFGRDVFAVYVGYALRLFTPLVVTPFVARTLGPEGYGMAQLGLAVGMVATLFVEFGFPNSGTRDVAIAKTSQAVRQTLANVTLAKSLLIIPALLVSLLSILFVPLLRSHPAFAVVGTLAGIANGANLSWFFQGRSQMRKSVLIDLGASLSYAILALIVIRSQGDAIKLVWIQLLAFGGAATLAQILAIRDSGFGELSVRRAGLALKQSFALFLVRSTTLVYLNGSILLLGAISSVTEVSYFSAGERLVLLALNALGPLGQIIFPRIAKSFEENSSHAFRLVGLAMRVNLTIIIAFAVAMSLAGHWIILLLFGHKYFAAFGPLLVLSWMAPISVVNGMLATQVFIALGRDRTVLTAVFAGGIVNLSLAFFLVPIFGGTGMAMARFGSEGVVFLFLVSIAAKAGYAAKIIKAAPSSQAHMDF
jgi:PST family polysaccharide transporter